MLVEALTRYVVDAVKAFGVPVAIAPVALLTVNGGVRMYRRGGGSAELGRLKIGPPAVFHHVLRVWKPSGSESSSRSLALKLSTLSFSSSQPGSMLRVSAPTRPSERLTAQAVGVGPSSEQACWGVLVHDQLTESEQTVEV